MTATLKDIALRAGVSVKTVSNVVHGNIHVSEEKSRRVRAALEELNYQPNLPARYLRTGRIGVLAFAIPDLRNPYFSDVGNAIVAAASEQSYTVLLDHTGGERQPERLVANGLRPHLIDGIILNPLALECEDLQPQQINVPLVLLGERFFDVPYDHVAINNVEAARLATHHLVQMGRQRIAAVGAQARLSGATARLRLQGYTEALTAASLPLDPQLVVESVSYHRLNGAQAVQHLLSLEHPPDAIFCFNDLMALGAIRALHKAGLRVPEDVAVVGFDDIEDGRFSTPSLTTIVPDKQQIGSVAVSLLLERINGTLTGAPRRVDIPFHLVVRESTAGIGATEKILAPAMPL